MNKETYKVQRKKSFTPHTTSFTRTGFNLIGWNDKDHKTNNPPQYPIGQTIVGGFNKDVDLYALWSAIMCTLTLNVNPSSGGTASGDGTYAYGSIVSINASPAERSTFLRWSDGNTSAARTITLTSDQTLTAHFLKLCTVKYKVNVFGCTPTLTTVINGTQVDKTTVSTGETIVSIDTQEGLDATLTISDIPDDCMIYISGNKQSGKSYSFKTFDGLIESLNIFIIQNDHDFDPIKGQYHTATFIYSPGTLIGGLKYKFHWQSQNATDLRKETETAGLIWFGHNGTATSHKMHLYFGYQIDDGDVNAAIVSFYDGSSYTGYYTANNDDTTFVKAKTADNIQFIGATGLGTEDGDTAQTKLMLNDYILDFSNYDMNTTIKIGICLKDYSTGCTGITFGRRNTSYKTKCIITIV